MLSTPKFTQQRWNPTNGSWWIVQIPSKKGFEVSTHCRGSNFGVFEASRSLTNLQRIAGLMLFYLKTQEVVNRLQCSRILCCNPHCCSSINLLKAVLDLAL